MKLTTAYTGLLAGVLAGMPFAPAASADEFLALPGLWKTTYEIEDSSASAQDAAAAGPQARWLCVDEEADPWVAFAQLHDLPGMTCSRSSLTRNSTSLQWKTQCHGPGPEAVADLIEATGAIVFDSPQHYTGWVKFNGMLMGYPLRSGSKLEGTRKAACTSPSD